MLRVPKRSSDVMSWFRLHLQTLCVHCTAPYFITLLPFSVNTPWIDEWFKRFSNSWEFKFLSQFQVCEKWFFFFNRVGAIVELGLWLMWKITMWEVIGYLEVGLLDVVRELMWRTNVMTWQSPSDNSPRRAIRVDGRRGQWSLGGRTNQHPLWSALVDDRP